MNLIPNLTWMLVLKVEDKPNNLKDILQFLTNIKITTLVNMIGATVLVKKVSVKSSSFTKLSLVDFGAIPALLKSTFNPSSLTISSISFTKCS